MSIDRLQSHYNNGKINTDLTFNQHGQYYGLCRWWDYDGRLDWIGMCSEGTYGGEYISISRGVVVEHRYTVGEITIDLLQTDLTGEDKFAIVLKHGGKFLSEAALEEVDKSIKK